MHGKVLKSQKKCSFFAYRGQGTIFLKKANREPRTIFPFFGTTFGRSGSGRDPVGIQSGSSRDPVGIQSGPSRDPVGSSRHRCPEPAKITKNCIFAWFWHVLG